jgi:hypothetical protein
VAGNEIARELAEKLFPDTNVSSPRTTIPTTSTRISSSIPSASRDGKKCICPRLHSKSSVRSTINLSRSRFSVLKLTNGQTKKKRLTPGEYRAAMRGEGWKFRLIKGIDEALEYSPDKTASS